MKTSAATTEPSNLLFDRSELASARAIAIMVPGALSRISMFDDAAVWRSRGYGLVHYRFPGLDGRAIAPPLQIAQAAQEIVALAARYPDTPLRLLGFSTGAAIVMSATAHLTGTVRVALMSSAVTRGGGADTFRRGVQDMAAAALRARTLNRRRIWLEYYRVLLFGRGVVKDADLSRQARQIIEMRRDKIVYPDEGRPEAHTSDLRRWRVPKTLRYAPGQARLFWGMDDPVFSRRQQERLARQIGASLTAYAGHGHLTFATHPAIFDDIFDHFEDRPAMTGGGVSLL